MRFLILGNPENRRVTLFQDACRRSGILAPLVVSWEVFLCDAEVLKRHLSSVDCLRIESPGENSEVERRLIQRGGEERLEKYEKGRILGLSAWFKGWRTVLEEISDIGFEVMNSPDSIGLMFDKLECQRRLRDHGIPVPQILGEIEGGKALYSKMEKAGVKRAFVKPRHGSSASGVIALQVSGERILATTSAKFEKGKIYNSLRLSRYETRSEVTALIDALGQENLMAERWFPKATFDGRVTDFRVLVIAGEVRHIVARTSRSPLTNLHLGNARGDLVSIQNALPDETWRLAMETCKQAADVFPECLYVAIDLMIGADFKSVAVAEVNAFGDLLPNLYSRGEDPYQAEIRAYLNRKEEGGLLK